MSNKKAKGKRSKTRSKFKARGKKTTVTQLVKGYSENEQVHICIDPSIHSGMPASKYQGYCGEIVGKRGGSYEIAVPEGSLSRMLIIHPAHLKSMKGAKS